MAPYKLLSRAEAASHLGLRPRHVYDLFKQGALPAVRVGRVLKFDVKQLDEWLSARTANAPDAEPEPLDAPVVNPLDAQEHPFETQLLAALVAEQRRTNVLLTRLLNYGRRA